MLAKTEWYRFRDQPFSSSIEIKCLPGVQLSYRTAVHSHTTVRILINFIIQNWQRCTHMPDFLTNPPLYTRDILSPSLHPPLVFHTLKIRLVSETTWSVPITRMLGDPYQRLRGCLVILTYCYQKAWWSLPIVTRMFGDPFLLLQRMLGDPYLLLQGCWVILTSTRLPGIREWGFPRNQETEKTAKAGFKEEMKGCCKESKTVDTLQTQ